MNKLRVGCIADDFTGATDLANNLARSGMRVRLLVGVSDSPKQADVDASVVALKTRTVPSAEAVKQSLDACRALKASGAQQIYFKICSTFDSTPRGNIGPVLESLMDELRCGLSVVAPAFPENARTVYQGHLFVGDLLLSDSSMRHHPVTPMTDSNLLRLLRAQLKQQAGRRVGLINHAVVSATPELIEARLQELAREGFSIAIADCITHADLVNLAQTLRDEPLVTASSGLGLTLPRAWGFQPSPKATQLPACQGKGAILAGSCSTATNRQVNTLIQAGGDALRIDAFDVAKNPAAALEHAGNWVRSIWSRSRRSIPLVYSTVSSERLAESQRELGMEQAGALLEDFFGQLCQVLHHQGLGRLIVAGGETSGACVQALGIKELQIGRQIDPGVPWCYAGESGLHLALKSGNFGRDDFFRFAFEILDETAPAGQEI